MTQCLFKTIIIFIFFNSFCIPIFSTPSKKFEDNQNFDQYIHACASLLFHLRMKTNSSGNEAAIFKHEEVSNLWCRIEECHPSANRIHAMYDEVEHLMGSKQEQQALLLFHQTFNSLSNLWKKAVKYEQAKLSFSIIDRSARSSKNQDFESNLIIPDDVKSQMRPYVIPECAMKKKLDELFFSARMTQDMQTFHKSGFKTLRVGPRSHVHVASHSNLPSYLVKAYMDNELAEKGKHPSWHWLVKRCEGAKKIKTIIEQKNIKHFTVASKWIYPFPENPSPPSFPLYTRHLALLLVKNMKLASKRENYQAWLHAITKAHLDELYIIISRAKGSSYRPDNIAYTTEGNFAFIDTEYPSRGPDYASIRRYLNADMQEYWDYLVRNGGEE